MKQNVKCKRSEIIVSTFPNQNRFKLEINNQKISGKSLNNWRLENTSQQPTGQTSHKGNAYSELNENENRVYQNLLDSLVPVFNRETYSSKCSYKGGKMP